MNFSAEPEISACGHVGRYFPARLPSKGRLESDAPVGVLVGRNRGRRKKLSAVEYSDGGCGLPELTTWRNPNPIFLKLFYDSDTMLKEKKYTNSH